MEEHYKVTNLKLMPCSMNFFYEAEGNWLQNLPTKLFVCTLTTLWSSLCDSLFVHFYEILFMESCLFFHRCLHICIFVTLNYIMSD